MRVFVEPCKKYDEPALDRAPTAWSEIFASRIRPGGTVVMKPNWISHRRGWRGRIELSRPRVPPAVPPSGRQEASDSTPAPVQLRQTTNST